MPMQHNISRLEAASSMGLSSVDDNEPSNGSSAIDIGIDHVRALALAHAQADADAAAAAAAESLTEQLLPRHAWCRGVLHVTVSTAQSLGFTGARKIDQLTQVHKFFLYCSIFYSMVL